MFVSLEGADPTCAEAFSVMSLAPQQDLRALSLPSGVGRCENTESIVSPGGGRLQLALSPSHTQAVF